MEAIHQYIKPNFNFPFRVVIHSETNPKNVPLHWHQAIEINCMLDWPLSKVVVGERNYRMETGTIWCANSMETHSVFILKNSQRHKAVSLILPVSFVKSLFPKLAKGRIEINDVSQFSSEQKNIYQEKIFPKFQAIYASFKKNTDFVHLDIYQKVLEILRLIFQYFFVDTEEVSQLNQEQIDRIYAIRNYVQKYYQTEITSDDLAKAVHLSRSYLYKFIKRNFRMTLNEYINLIRCEHIIKEIQKGTTKQTDLAFNNGFSGLKTMNRYLKKYYLASAKELIKAQGDQVPKKGD